MSHNHHCCSGHDACGGHEEEHEHHHHHGHEHHHDCCCHEHGDFAGDLLELADEAWMEVLKEKIKEQILSSHGPHMDQLAKLISQSNGERWKNKMEIQKTKRDFRQGLQDFFSH